MSMLEVLLWGFSVVIALELAAIVLFSNRSNGEQRTMSSADESIAMGPLPNVELHSSNNGEHRTMSSSSRSGRKKWIFKVFTCSSSSRDEKEKEKNRKTQKQKRFPKKPITEKPANDVGVGKRANRAQEMKKKKTSLPDELETIAGACHTRDCLAITDEVYEHITYDNETHISLASLPGMQRQTIITFSLSKTYSVTGWRIGWAVAYACIASAIRSIHTKLMDSASAPFQEAALTALRSPLEYFESLRKVGFRKQ
ncbi:unnamed protein product [Camellia sinensis]